MTTVERLYQLLLTHRVNAVSDLPPDIEPEGLLLELDIAAEQSAADAARRARGLAAVARGRQTRINKAFARTQRIASAFRAGATVAALARSEKTSRSRIYWHLVRARLHPPTTCAGCGRPLEDRHAS